MVLQFCMVPWFTGVCEVKYIRCPMPYLCRNNNSNECNREISVLPQKCGDVYYCPHFESKQCYYCGTCEYKYDIDRCYDCEPCDSMLFLYKKEVK